MEPDVIPRKQPGIAPRTPPTSIRSQPVSDGALAPNYGSGLGLSSVELVPTTFNGRAEMLDSATQIFSLIISKVQNEGLGFSIIEGPGKKGIYVAYILDDTQARLNGLQPNDQIIEINGENVEDADRVMGAVILRSLGPGPVTLKICRSANVFSESLLYYLAKLSGLTSGASGMHERLYGEKYGFFGVRQSSALDRQESVPVENSKGQKWETPLITSKSQPIGAAGFIPQNSNVNGKLKTKTTASAKVLNVTEEKHPTRLAGFSYIAVFVVETVASLAVIVLECITAGLFTSFIGGAEYVGIYVGVFGLLTGLVGLFSAVTKVVQSHELKLYLTNVILQSVCMIQTLALFGASAGLLARHVKQNEAYNATTDVTASSQRTLLPLLGLKAAVLALYIVIFLTTIVFFCILTLKTRSRIMTHSLRKV